MWIFWHFWLLFNKISNHPVTLNLSVKNCRSGWVLVDPKTRRRVRGGGNRLRIEFWTEHVQSTWNMLLHSISQNMCSDRVGAATDRRATNGRTTVDRGGWSSWSFLGRVCCFRPVSRQWRPCTSVGKPKNWSRISVLVNCHLAEWRWPDCRSIPSLRCQLRSCEIGLDRYISVLNETKWN